MSAPFTIALGVFLGFVALVSAFIGGSDSARIFGTSKLFLAASSLAMIAALVLEYYA